MQTISWRDIAYTEDEGAIRFNEFLITIRAEHIARWKEDPDGRFRLKRLSAEAAELETFFPNL